MWNKIKSFFIYASEEGLRFPFAYDGKTESPSATLFYTYIAFICCLFSIGFMYFKPEVINPAIFSTLLFVICLTVYRMRRLDDVEVNLSEKSIKISSEEEHKESKETYVKTN